MDQENPEEWEIQERNIPFALPGKSHHPAQSPWEPWKERGGFVQSEWSPATASMGRKVVPKTYWRATEESAIHATSWYVFTAYMFSSCFSYRVNHSSCIQEDNQGTGMPIHCIWHLRTSLRCHSQMAADALHRWVIWGRIMQLKADFALSLLSVPITSSALPGCSPSFTWYHTNLRCPFQSQEQCLAFSTSSWRVLFIFKQGLGL